MSLLIVVDGADCSGGCCGDWDGGDGVGVSLCSCVEWWPSSNGGWIGGGVGSVCCEDCCIGSGGGFAVSKDCWGGFIAVFDSRGWSGQLFLLWPTRRHMLHFFFL